MGGKSKGHVITPEETMALIEQQQVMNNPNVSNMFGDTQTTFGADGQAQITQTPSEAMRGLILQQQDFVGGGSPQLNLQRDQNADSMMNQFNSRASERMGAPPPMGLDQMANLGQPRTPPQNKPMLMQDNDPNNGVPIGDGSQKPDFMNKIKQLSQNMNGGNQNMNSLATALMNMSERTR